MVDFKRWEHSRGSYAPRPRHYSAPGGARYMDPVLAPLQAARRLWALEGWVEYEQYERTTQPRI